MNTQDLIKILVCPKCRGELEAWTSGKEHGFACAACQIVYPVTDGIPVMLVDQAIPACEWPKKTEV